MLCQFLLYNKVNQLYVYIYPHIPSLLHLPPTLPIPPLQVVTKHRADLPMQLLPTSYLFYIWQCIYVNTTLSLCPSLHVPFPMSSSPFSTFASLFLCCPQVRQNHFFFFLDSNSICICQYTVFVFLFLTYFTLYDRLQVHPPHYKYLNFISLYG